MNNEDVTHDTRNHQTAYAEIKLVVDLLASAALIYYATHPDCLSDVGEHTRRLWGKVVHHVSVWVTRQNIRNLPETDE